jgi:hypothetical protein
MCSAAQTYPSDKPCLPADLRACVRACVRLAHADCAMHSTHCPPAQPLQRNEAEVRSNRSESSRGALSYPARVSHPAWYPTRRGIPPGVVSHPAWYPTRRGIPPGVVSQHGLRTDLESFVKEHEDLITELLPRQRRQRNLARRRDKVKDACVPMRRLSVNTGFYNVCRLPNRTSWAQTSHINSYASSRTYA